jgi:molybdate transport system substrate-binding protein
MSIKRNARSVIKVAAWACLLAVAAADQGRAAEIRFLADSTLQSAMEELIPEFQKASGHTVKVTYAAPGANTERVRKGEPADVAIVSSEQWDSLQKDGKLAPGTRVVIARAGVAIFVKKGAVRPPVGSVDDVKRALAGAGSIAVGDPGRSPVGRHVLSLLDRLGIAAGVKPKLRLADSTDAAIQIVAKGEAAIGLAETTDIMLSADVEAAGPLPPEIQRFTTFAAAIPASANQAAAKSLVDFLLSPPAVRVLKAMGLECGITEQNVSQPFSCFLGPPGEGLKIMTRGLRAPK